MMPLTAALLQTIPTGTEYVRILPELVLSAFGIVIMLLDPILDEEKSQKSLGLIALLGTLAGLASTWYMSQSPGLAFSNMVRVDAFSVFFHVLVIAVAAVVILTSYEYMTVQKIRAGEYYGLILFGVVGMRGAASGASVNSGSAMISASGSRVRALSLARGNPLVKTSFNPFTRSSNSSGGALCGSRPASW